MFINAAANHLHFATTTKDYTFTQNIFLNSQKGQKQTHSLSSLKFHFNFSFFLPFTLFNHHSAKRKQPELNKESYNIYDFSLSISIH
jgi:hypothetical protein